MLRKLIKHELRATARVMGPLYLVLLATALGANLSTRGMLETSNIILNILGGLFVTAFTLAIFGVCLMSFVLMVRRFYKNLLGDEGYLMFTLPASVHQQVWSKLIVSAVWFAATAVVVCLAAFLMAFDVDVLTGFAEVTAYFFRQLTAYYAINGTALMLEFLLLCFVGCCAMCLGFYAALAVGHSRPRHKLAWSVVCYFAFQFIAQTVFILVMNALGEFLIPHSVVMALDAQLSRMAALHLAMGLMILLAVLYGAIFYIVTTVFLKKRLNLE